MYNDSEYLSNYSQTYVEPTIHKRARPFVDIMDGIELRSTDRFRVVFLWVLTYKSPNTMIVEKYSKRYC